MPVVTTRILEYRCELRSTPDENVALAYLLGEADRLVAMVACVEGTAALPGPRENVSGVVMLTLRRGEFADLVGMLRNEKPLHFSWSRDAQVATLSTRDEPTGEAEPWWSR
jgi:hypothetical protein